MIIWLTVVYGRIAVELWKSSMITKIHVTRIPLVVGTEEPCGTVWVKIHRSATVSF